MADWRSMFDRKYVGAWDLGGRDVVVEIVRVVAETLVNKAGKNKKPVVYFKGKEVGFALNKTNAKAIASMYGNDTAKWVGKRITIYPTMASFGGNEVEAIRVRPTAPSGKGREMPEIGPVDEEMCARQETAALEAADAQS